MHALGGVGAVVVAVMVMSMVVRGALLFVRYRCYAGISSSKNFSFSAWARLLQAQLPEDQQNNPDWAQLQTALQQRLKGHAVAYATAHAREPTAPAASAP